MTRRHVFALSMLILLLYTLPTRLGTRNAKASDGYLVHNLNTGIGYTTIQEAINANETLDEHTILVDSAIYYERVLITKALAIIGEDPHTTIIDGGNLTSVFELQSNNITVTGFTIRNCGPHSGGRAFSLDNVKNCNISRNNLDGNYYGIWMSSSNVTVFRNNITNNNVGALLISSFDDHVIENNVLNNLFGVELVSSSNNTIVGNEVTGNSHGIALYSASNSNRIYENSITNNGWGVEIYASINNKIYHNNFTNNTYQVFFHGNGSDYPNVWDDGYPSGGNYWSDYTTRYPNATEIDASRVWNTPYVIEANNTDRYPLMTQYVIAEFPSFLVLPLFMTATLVAFIVKKLKLIRKQVR